MARTVEDNTPTELYPFEGKACTVREISDKTGIALRTLVYRLKFMLPEEAVKVGNKKLCIPTTVCVWYDENLNWYKIPVNVIAKEVGCKPSTFLSRLSRHTVREAVEMGKAVPVESSWGKW